MHDASSISIYIYEVACLCADIFWGFHKWVIYPPHGWLITENPMKLDDLGVSLF